MAEVGFEIIRDIEEVYVMVNYLSPQKGPYIYENSTVYTKQRLR